MKDFVSVSIVFSLKKKKKKKKKLIGDTIYYTIKYTLAKVKIIYNMKNK